MPRIGLSMPESKGMDYISAVSGQVAQIRLRLDGNNGSQCCCSISLESGNARKSVCTTVQLYFGAVLFPPLAHGRPAGSKIARGILSSPARNIIVACSIRMCKERRRRTAACDCNRSVQPSCRVQGMI